MPSLTPPRLSESRGYEEAIQARSEATPAANGIGVAAPTLAGMPDRIKVEPVNLRGTGPFSTSGVFKPSNRLLSTTPLPWTSHTKRRHLIVVGSRAGVRSHIRPAFPA